MNIAVIGMVGIVNTSFEYLSISWQVSTRSGAFRGYHVGSCGGIVQINVSSFQINVS